VKTVTPIGINLSGQIGS